MTKSRKKHEVTFDEKTRTMALLWCDRHCCLCKEACGIDIEVHHIVPRAAGGTADIDNAIPLCFKCHSKVGHYSDNAPRGTKFKPPELKARREQVYEEFTQHLVPPIHYEVTQRHPAGKRLFPDVGLIVSHLGDTLPVRLRTRLQILVNDTPILTPSGHYGGHKLWNLNPRFTALGHFDGPVSIASDERLEIKVTGTIVDRYGREHERLPIGFVYMPDVNDWYLEP